MYRTVIISREHKDQAPPVVDLAMTPGEAWTAFGVLFMAGLVEWAVNNDPAVVGAALVCLGLVVAANRTE